MKVQCFPAPQRDHFGYACAAGLARLTARTQQPGLYISKPDGILGTHLAGRPVTLLPLPVPVRGSACYTVFARFTPLQLHLRTRPIPHPRGNSPACFVQLTGNV